MNKTSLFSWTAVLTGVSLFIHSSPAAVPDTAPAPTNAPIPWDQIGAKAGANYRGDGLRVTAQDDRVKLNCVFQRLEGETSPEGLWLTSTVTNQVQDRFRVVATALGRTGSKPIGANLTNRFPRVPAQLSGPTPGPFLEPSSNLNTVGHQLLGKKWSTHDRDYRITRFNELTPVARWQTGGIPRGKRTSPLASVAR